MALAGAGFVFTSLALLSVGSGDAAQAQALANHNSSAPVDFAANSIEVQDRVFFAAALRRASSTV